MKTTRIPTVLTLFIGWLGSLAAGSAAVPTMIEALNTNGQVQVHLSWPAEADRQYDILTSTNLGNGAWWLATPNPIAPTNLIGQFQQTSTNRTRFFQVAPRDTAGPEITARYPATNGIGVGRFATLSLALTDETGVDASRFALTFNSLTLTNGSPGVSASANQFQYAPGTNAWGDYGATSAVTFVCADLLGNTTTSAWTFILEVRPVLTNVLLHLPPPASGTGGVLAKAAKGHGASFVQGLSILFFETNLIVFSYTGTNYELYAGAILVSHDPARFFYRLITRLVEDAANHLVMAYTTDVSLTTIVKDGTFSPEVFVTATGAKAAAKWWTVELGYAVPFSYASELSVLPLEFDTDGDDQEDLRITPGVLSLDLRGEAGISCVIKGWKVVALDASISSQLAAEIRARVEFFGRLDLLNKTKTLATVPLAYVVGFIGPVPVWVELQLGVDLGLQANAEAAVSFETGLDAYATSDFRLGWRPNEGMSKSYNGSFNLVPVPLDVGFQVSADAFLYLKPRLSALVYSLAGVSADYRRGPALEAVWELGEPQCEITLYDQWSINAGMTIVGVPDGELPEITLLEEKRQIQSWYWPPIAEKAPVFTRHPAGLSAPAGTTVTLEARATGNPEPAYQWFQNGIGIPFQMHPTLTFTMSAGAAGTYHVMAKNRLGWVNSSPAAVWLSGGAAPSGMALIPAGSFEMGDALGDCALYGWCGYERPVHTVYVSAFYMDRTEVTKALWDEVYQWATTHGYSFEYGAGGKAADHPAHTMTWYDSVKWCNARSQREGRSPSYYTDSVLTQVYKSGQVAPYVKWNAGYRLPTEAEWEKAARGGLSGKRFPWGDTISHSQANYYSLADYSYDISPTRGYHPAYNDGVYPYTSPVGSFAPNGYGLYDMAGNVWEWCWDWWDGSYYSSSPGSDPRGPSSGGSYRVLRGGSWYFLAWLCRAADRNYYWPDRGDDSIGFRSVLPPGQP
jgi:formylglycine-generating enzyme required for sulfatase activity